MSIFIILFLVLAVLVLFSAHFFLYFSTITFFSISNSTYKTVLAIGMAFFGASFFMSNFLNRLGDNIFTRAFYFLSGIWLGLLLNFLLAIVLSWLTIWLFRFGNSNVNIAILATVFFSLSVCFSFYGIWNSMNPQMKKITVTIPNLPENWKGKKVVQLSDLHIGHVYRANFLEKVVEKVNANDPAMVLITGDLFDGMDGNLTEPIQPLNDIQAEKGIYYVTGNHETYLGLDNVFKALQETKVKRLNDEVTDVDGLKLIGINYPNRSEKKDIVEILKSMEKDFVGQPNIFLYHSPIKIDQFKKLGVNLQLAGHTHKGQLFPFNFVSSFVYKGYDYGLHEDGDYTLYTTSGTGAWGPTMRTGNRPEIVVITLQ